MNLVLELFVKWLGVVLIVKYPLFILCSNKYRLGLWIEEENKILPFDIHQIKNDYIVVETLPSFLNKRFGVVTKVDFFIYVLQL